MPDATTNGATIIDVETDAQRIAKLEKNVAAGTAKIAKLEKTLNELAWYHAELIHALKVAAAQQLLSNPEVQQQMINQLVSGM